MKILVIYTYIKFSMLDTSVRREDTIFRRTVRDCI